MFSPYATEINGWPKTSAAIDVSFTFGLPCSCKWEQRITWSTRYDTSSFYMIAFTIPLLNIASRSLPRRNYLRGSSICRSITNNHFLLVVVFRVNVLHFLAKLKRARLLIVARDTKYGAHARHSVRAWKRTARVGAETLLLASNASRWLGTKHFLLRTDAPAIFFCTRFTTHTVATEA